MPFDYDGHFAQHAPPAERPFLFQGGQERLYSVSSLFNEFEPGRSAAPHRSRRALCRSCAAVTTARDRPSARDRATSAIVIDQLRQPTFLAKFPATVRAIAYCPLRFLSLSPGWVKPPFLSAFWMSRLKPVTSKNLAFLPFVVFLCKRLEFSRPTPAPADPAFIRLSTVLRRRLPEWSSRRLACGFSKASRRLLVHVAGTQQLQYLFLHRKPTDRSPQSAPPCALAVVSTLPPST